MTVANDNSYDSNPIACTFPLLCCNKKDLSGKGEAEDFLWLWETSSMPLAEEKCRPILSKERKMLLLLHSLFNGFLSTQIMHTEMESTDLLS